MFTYAARATVTIQVLETLSLSARHGTPGHLYTAQRYVRLVTAIRVSADNIGLSDFEVHPAQNFRRRGPQDVLLQDGVRCFAIHLRFKQQSDLDRKKRRMETVKIVATSIRTLKILLIFTL